MFSLGLILAFLFLALFGLTSTVNYCDPSLCTDNNIVKHHIACDNNGEFRSNCLEPAIIEITQKMKNSILFWHNEYRNKVANGSLEGFQSARRMTTVTWDTELAYLAGLSVLTCDLELDECHNTFAYKYSGQNLASQYHKSIIAPATYENITVSFIKKWFDEYKFANQRDVDTCSESALSRNIGHFTAMIQEKSAKIGCGLARFSEIVKGNKWYVILLDCKYSFTNVIDMPIYVKGPMGSACETGPNPDFNGLCSPAEYVPPIHDLDAIGLPAAQHPAHGKSIVPRPRPLYKPTRRVVKPYNPNETFYIKTELNPEVRGIIRPVPVVTWRGPVYSKNQTTRPASTQQTQVTSHRDQTAYKRIVPNLPVRFNDTIQPVLVSLNDTPEISSRTSTQQAQTSYNRVVPNPAVRSKNIIQPVPVATNQGPRPRPTVLNVDAS